MYCEESAATHIEHFRPRSADTLGAFAWDNYLLACSACNSNYKRDEFPLTKSGEPLLLNPTVDEPADHLALSPSTGKYAPIRGSQKAVESIRVFGLNRSLLETARRDAWLLSELGIIGYARALDNNDLHAAEEIAAVLRRLPCAGLLRTLVAVLGDPAMNLVSRECQDAWSARRQAFDWLEH